jgi:hypothetical protein
MRPAVKDWKRLSKNHWKNSKNNDSLYIRKMAEKDVYHLVLIDNHTSKGRSISMTITEAPTANAGRIKAHKYMRSYGKMRQ